MTVYYVASTEDWTCDHQHHSAGSAFACGQKHTPDGFDVYRRTEYVGNFGKIEWVKSADEEAE